MISKNQALIVKNVLITTSGKYGEYVLALIASAIVARALGPDHYGIYTFSIFICAWMIQLSNISLPTTVIRYVAESRGRGQNEVSRNIAGMLLRRQTVSSILVCVVFLIVSQFFRPEVLKEQQDLLFLLIVISVFFKARYNLLISIAKGYERFDIEAVASILVGILSTCAVFYLAATEKVLIDFVVVFTIACFLLQSSAWVLCKRNAINYSIGSIEPDYLAKIHKYRRLTVLFGAVVLFSGHAIEVFLLGQYGSTVEIGYFGLSIALTRGLGDLTTVGLTAVLMPSLAHAFGASNLAAVRKIFLESTRYYIFFGIAMGLSGFLIADPIIRSIYGNDFEGAIWVLGSLLFIGGFGMAGASVGAFISTTDRQDIRVKFAIAVLIVNAISAIIFVPTYGLLGAVISSGVTSIFSLVLGFQWINRNLGEIVPYRLYMKLFISGFLALVLVAPFSFYTDLLIVDIVAALLFACLYFFLTIKLNCWRREDLNLLNHLIGYLPESIAHPVNSIIGRFGG